MKVVFDCTYSGSVYGTVELPEGKTWNDVTDWYVKWGTIYVAFDRGGCQELGEIGDITLDSIDFKRPDRVTVYEADAAGNLDFDKELDSREQF